MNYLIRHLTTRGIPTVFRLRSLYRRLAILTHPDRARTSGDRFVGLQVAYREALSLLSDSQPEKTQVTLLEHRVAVLKSLYRYALKFNGRDAEETFSVLLEQTKAYRPEVYEDMLRYEIVFRNTYANWRNDVYTYDAHHAWISAIVEMARFLSDGWSGYRKLMNKYLAELNDKVAFLDERRGRTLLRLSKWLAEEAEGPRVELIYE
jgi:hypothetical protein